VDANGTRFHLLIGREDWARCLGAGDAGVPLAVDFDRSPTTCGSGDTGFGWEKTEKTIGSVTLRPCLVTFTAAPNDTPPDPTGAGRRGAASDRFGNIYWIDAASAEIRVTPVASGRAAHFWSASDEIRVPERRYGEFHAAEDAPPRPALQLAGLAVTDDHYLVAGVVQPPGFLVFDLHAGGPPQQLTWPSRAAALVPFDLAPRRGGGVWVLDRVARRYWALDRYLSPEPLGHPLATIDPGAPDDFQPLEPGPVRRTVTSVFPTGVPIDAVDPIAIEALPDGSTLILDRRAARDTRLWRDGIDGRYGAAQPMQPFAVDGYDLVFVAKDPSTTAITGRVFVAAAEGNQATVFDLETRDDGTVSFRPSTEYLPMRLFGGKGLIAGGKDALYDVGDGWVPLVQQRRPRYVAAATLRTPVFDGREPGCVWHRLMLDGCVPPDTSIRVRSRAADEELQLPMARWQNEPDPYLRHDGSEFPLSRPPREERDGTWELLFQRARGRYLEVELTLAGNERATPRLRALRAYYPRFSYLQHYLPAVYREDDASASFLDRFLANLEGFNTTIEDRMAAAQALFDVRSTPADALDWLASWFGVALDPSWNESKRRLFIAHAPEFFRQRGTTQGVQNAIRLAIDDCVDSRMFSAAPRRLRGRDQIRIVENYRMRRLSPEEAGDNTGEIGPREIPAAARWKPKEGRARLTKRYREFLASRGLTLPAKTEYPIRQPQDGDAARLWRAFSREVLNFVPSAGVSDLPAWQAFLSRRYRAARALNPVYGAAAGGDVSLPDRLPPDGNALRDWFDFESTVMTVRRSAHRFSVLLPLPRSQDNTETFRRTRLDLVRRVVELEKPAHTVFDVKFYWALFRLGAARLGDDTLVYRGGREADLQPPLRLGQGYLAESYLEPGHPQNVDARFIVGRDPRGGGPETGETRA